MKDSSSVELRHLRTFLAVAETENFTRAAERLAVTQPSISGQIRELEGAVGAQLFSRLGPRVALTPAGRVFRERAAIVLGKLNEACQAVQDTEDLVAGHVSVAVIPPLHVPWMPRVLGQIAREHPGLAVTLIEKSSDHMEITVETGRCDLGIGILSRASPNLTYELLRTDELVLIERSDGPFRRRRSVSAEEVGQRRLVVLPESFVLRRLTDEAFRQTRVRPRYSFQVDTIEGVLATVVAGGLCTLMPQVVLGGREALGLRSVKLRNWGSRLEFGLIWPGSGEPGAAARLLADRIRASARRRSPES